MAGYHNFSMSNNAVAAYSHGEMPLSKWTKTAIIAAIHRAASDYQLSEQHLATLEKAPATWLRDTALHCTSWHHTSCHYNKTDFYSIALDDIAAMTIEEIAESIAEHKTAKSTAQAAEKKSTLRHVRYLTWSGSRRRPRATAHEEKCEIIGNWAYTSHGKKSINGTGFSFLD